MVALHIPCPSAPTRSAAQLARAAESREAAQYDAILVTRFNGGDAAAFNEIVARYREKMLHVALRRLNNHADAEEIVQDTFIRAHRGLGAFRGESSLAAWLYRIAVNLSCNRHWYFFRRRRHATMSLDASVSETNPASLEEFLPGENTSPVQAACLSEFGAVVAGCMAQLPFGQREILTLRNVQQHSYQHISRLLGIRVGTAKSRIGRARTTLRALLGQTYPELRNQALSLACFEPASATPGLAVACA
jgi:RNA polymerase sigma-70 factor (ECF subfamily)